MSTPQIEAIKQHVIEGQLAAVEAEVRRAMEAGISNQAILYEALIPAMAEVGRRFECGDYYIPDMLVAARAMQAGLGLIKPYLATGQAKSIGRVVIGTVKGDMHDIGKNLVAMMLEGAGFEIFDLGINVPPERFAAAIRERGAQVLALSALLTTTMLNMKSIIKALEDLGLRQRVKVIVGGAPVDAKFATDIGADGYAPDASRAVTVIKRLLD